MRRRSLAPIDGLLILAAPLAAMAQDKMLDAPVPMRPNPPDKINDAGLQVAIDLILKS